MLDLVTGILATWRLTSLLHSEDGPFEIFARFRDWAGIKYDEQSQPVSENQLGKMIACVWCLSIWTGLAITVLQGNWSVVRILAYSAGAIWIEELRGRNG